MTTNELLVRLQQLGVALAAEGDQLRCRAPKGVLTAELREALATNKVELLTCLRAAADALPAERSVHLDATSADSPAPILTAGEPPATHQLPLAPPLTGKQATNPDDDHCYVCHTLLQRAYTEVCARCG